MLQNLKKKVQNLEKQITDLEQLCTINDNAAYDAALRLEEQVEKTTLLARQLPACTGRPTAYADSQQVIMDAVPVEIGYTPEGWFRLALPSLLPKKTHGSVNYYRGILYPAMHRFFQCNRERRRYRSCVLIYRHVYTPDRPERRMRDHDNYEVNMVTDIVALYTMPDDSPAFCTHFYCTARGESDHTEVYVVPVKDFRKWLDSMPWNLE